MERKLNECGILRQAQATAFDWLMHCLALTWKTAFLIAILLQTESFGVPLLLWKRSWS